jgi:hypothetical protein
MWCKHEGHSNPYLQKSLQPGCPPGVARISLLLPPLLLHRCHLGAQVAALRLLLQLAGPFLGKMRRGRGHLAAAQGLPGVGSPPCWLA